MSREEKLNPENKEILKPIETIGFDIGGIIFPDLHLPIVGEIAKKLGFSSKTALEIFDDVWVKLAIGEAAEDELWSKLLKKSKKRMPMTDLKEFYRSFLVPDSKVVGLVEQLAQRYPLLLVSNTAKEWFDYELDHFDLRRFFVTAVTSFESGARKPKPEFFNLLLKKINQLSYSPEVCLFIDDSKRNIKAASEFGFQGILFKDISSLKDELTKRGVVFE